MPTLRRPLRGSLVMTSGSVMKGPASSGHVVRTGSLVRSGWRTIASCTLASRTVFGTALASGAKRKRAASLLDHRGTRRREVEKSANALRHVVEMGGIQRHRHAPLRPELIRKDRKLRTFDVGEEEGRTAGLHDAIGDFADLEVGIDVARYRCSSPAARSASRNARRATHTASVINIRAGSGEDLAACLIATELRRRSARRLRRFDAVTVPPWACAIQRTIANPRPVPVPSRDCR